MDREAAGLELFDFSKMVGTVLQDTDGQFVGLTAAEDIAFAAENDGVPPEEMHRRVLEAAKLTQIEGYIDKSPQDLSGGQKQRVSMAGVLMDDVEILLFDEPLANLDPAAGKQAIEIIDRLHRETGKTILIIEHRLEDVLHRPVDRIIVLEKGRIKADMPPEELLASRVLWETGVREPLYLSCLRYAGLGFTAADSPASVEELCFDREALRAWDAAAPEPPVRPPLPVMLEVRGLSYSYEEIVPGHRAAHPPALEDLSFSIGRGERLSIAGKNGAGKSTLAALICGFMKPDAGKILFEEAAGRGLGDISRLSIKERAERIGFVMQNPNHMLSFPMVFDEAAYGLRTRGVGEGEIKDRVWEMLKICGLYPFRSWPVTALSFGQKKRLTIASILVLGSRLLILDEPTAGQDWRHYTEIMEFLTRLGRERGLSLVMITHDMHLMLEYTERAVVLANGKLVADGEPAEILSNDEVIEQASLKRTSLYDLALRASIADPAAFIRRFIASEADARRGL
jgi:energy-coupling factor transport system ATP-binding protein